LAQNWTKRKEFEILSPHPNKMARNSRLGEVCGMIFAIVFFFFFFAWLERCPSHGLIDSPHGSKILDTTEKRNQISI